MNRERFEQQLAFIKEIDKAKSILRRNRLLDDSRYENDAEHSWHLALMAIVLREYADDPRVDVSRVILMVLIHDLVEIGVGDAFIYDTESRAAQVAKEREAAQRVFGLLPEDQRDQLLALWREFEAKESPDAKFALVLDRMHPLIHNACTQGHAWRKHGVQRHQVEEVMRPVAQGSTALWQVVQELIEQSVQQGYLGAGDL